MDDSPVRKAVPLSPLELDALERLRTAGTVERAVLVELTGERSVKSESTTLQALVRLGLQRIEEQVLNQAYRRMAADPSAEDLAYEQAVRGRHRPSTATSA